jgi:hypothetical protein
MSVDTHNLLLGLAWLGELTTDQIRRLWMPDYHARSVRRHLRALRTEGYLACRRWALRAAGTAKTMPPQQQDQLWSLTRHAREQLREDDQYPPVYKEPRARPVVPHDVQTSATIVRMIELGRAIQTSTYAGISGLYVEREVRLDPERSRPVMDALVIVTIGGDFPDATRVPWSRDPAMAGEQRIRYALETDRHSEPLTVIQAKAVAYQQAGSPQWLARYGTFPLVVWITPSEARLQAILQVWRQAWPQGKWLMTTDAWLQGDRWLEYAHGQVRERGLFRTTPTLLPHTGNGTER